MLDGARKREIRARNFDQKRAKYERLEEEIMAKRLKIDEAWSEIQDIVFDFDVDETSEEEVGMATQTEESQYLFVSEPEKPFDDTTTKWVFTLVYLDSTLWYFPTCK